MKKIKPRILIVTGTRPDTIKMAPVILRLKKNKNFDTKFLVTGQHKELLKQALDVFKLKPDFDFKVMSKNQSALSVYIKILTKGELFLKKNKFDLVMVHGDTMTALAFSNLAYLHKIEIAHVEAGLRTYDLNNPFPEEGIRQMIDVYSRILFTPTAHSAKNFSKKDEKTKHVLVTGNTIVDALNLLVKSPKVKSKNTNILNDKKNILVTLHRRESFGDDLINIFQAIKKAALENEDSNFIIPVHPNPNVKKPIFSLLGKIKNIKLIEPVSYLEMISLLQQVHFIVTDSGGIQEEAPSFGKPVLVARKVTERPEGIKAGILKLVGTNTNVIYNAITKYLNDTKHYEKLTSIKNPYGDGKATERIERFLEKYFEIK